MNRHQVAARDEGPRVLRPVGVGSRQTQRSRLYVFLPRPGDRNQVARRRVEVDLHGLQPLRLIDLAVEHVVVLVTRNGGVSEVWQRQNIEQSLPVRIETVRRYDIAWKRLPAGRVLYGN